MKGCYVSRAPSARQPDTFARRRIARCATQVRHLTLVLVFPSSIVNALGSSRTRLDVPSPGLSSPRHSKSTERECIRLTAAWPSHDARLSRPVRLSRVYPDSECSLKKLPLRTEVAISLRGTRGKINRTLIRFVWMASYGKFKGEPCETSRTRTETRVETMVQKDETSGDNGRVGPLKLRVGSFESVVSGSWSRRAHPADLTSVGRESFRAKLAIDVEPIRVLTFLCAQPRLAIRRRKLRRAPRAIFGDTLHNPSRIGLARTAARRMSPSRSLSHREPADDTGLLFSLSSLIDQEKTFLSAKFPIQ